jgi:uncharacterized protein (TIGR02594 family)
MNLPKQYAWLNSVKEPRILMQALQTFGVKEQPGIGSNPIIMGWAEKVGVRAQYTNDAIPWCALGMSYWALQAGYDIPHFPLGAVNWLQFGDKVLAGSELLGDVLVFKRKGGGHVALYVGEDEKYFHILGANQNDQVCFERKAKSQLVGARRCHWRINQPSIVRKIAMAATGPVAMSEA